MKTNWTKKSKRKSWKNNFGVSLIFIAFTILLSGCGGQDARSTPEYFIPPTLAPRLETPTPEILLTPEEDEVVENRCINDLRFIDDVTIPDDTVVAPGEMIEKIWLVQNSGTCNWEADYTLRNTDGPPMGATTIQALYPLRSSGEVEIAISFIAPTDEGRHVSRWQAHDPEGVPFGQEIFVMILVDPELGPTPEPSPTPTLEPTAEN